MDRATNEFEEIGHCGGKIIFRIVTDEKGDVRYSVGFTHSRPVPAVITGIYALYPGIPVGALPIGGVGNSFPPPPLPNCFPVLVSSDSHGKFGHECPRCRGYWRSSSPPNICPYCALVGPSYNFLSDAQKRYVRHYCEVLGAALDSAGDAEVEIDMDIVADAAAKEGEKPTFYVSEESQQRKFHCVACEEFNDILGRFGYCSLCGTRNDLADFEALTIPDIRERLKAGTAPEDCVRDAVASFDSYMAQVAKQLAQRIPLTISRKTRLLKQRFHRLEEIQSTFKDWFDIEVYTGLKETERGLVVKMFHRRHVYEHNGGEVDQKYIDDSGDTSVRLKQHIHETQQDAHALLSSLVKIARNVHNGFHELFPPKLEPIKMYEDKKARINKYRSQMG